MVKSLDLQPILHGSGVRIPAAGIHFVFFNAFFSRDLDQTGKQSPECNNDGGYNMLASVQCHRVLHGFEMHVDRWYGTGYSTGNLG